MNSLLDESDATTQSHGTPGDRVQSTMAAVRLSVTWLGVRKSLTASQRNIAADSFGAEGKFLSAGKKLLDTSHPAFKAVTAIRGRAVHYWKSMSLPFPEPGLRLIPQDAVTEFDAQVTKFREELDDAVTKLESRYHEMFNAARNRLGDLFDPTDYPSSLIGMFAIEHDYPSIEPPSYLQQLSPRLYQQECGRMRARFDEAVQLAEQMFLDELTKLIEHLTERLSGDTDGKPKVFRDTAVTNLTAFFERFQRLNIRSNQQLDELVERARNVVNGVRPQQLRDNQQLRRDVATQLSGVQSVLDGLLVDRPRRNIIRRPR